MTNKVRVDIEGSAQSAVSEINHTAAALEKLGAGGKNTGLRFTELKSQIDLAVGALRTIAQVGQQAFNFGKEGAEVAQTAESFDRLIDKVGASNDLLAELRAASVGTISDLKLMSATTTLLAGTQGDLATNLANATPMLLEIAKAANKLNPSLGDTAFLYESIATGVKRASPLILDNLGLTIKIGDANAKYAAQLGKTVEQLTAEEQKQALLNATLEAGAVLIEQAGGAAGSATDEYAQFQAAIENAENSFKLLVTGPLGDAVTFFTRRADALNLLNTAFDDGAINILEYVGTLISLGNTGPSVADEVDYLNRKIAEHATYTDIAIDTTDAYVASLTSFLTPATVTYTAAVEDNTYKLQSQDQWLADIAGVGLPRVTEETNLATAAMQSYNEMLLFNTVSAGLNAEQQLLLAYNLGLVDDQTVAMYAGIDTLTAKYDLNNDGKVRGIEVTNEYLQALIALDSQIRGMDGLSANMYVNLNYNTPANPGAGYVFTGQTPDDVLNAPPGAPTPFAAGGRYAAGPRLVGERGPELDFPDSGGAVMNNDLLSRMVAAMESLGAGGAGGGMAFNFYGGGGSRELAADLRRVIQAHGYTMGQ